MEHLRPCALFTLVFLVPLSAAAQGVEGERDRMGIIRGQVVDGDTRLPLAGVAVTALSTHYPNQPTVVSGTDGWFSFPPLGVGTFTLRAEMLGYATARVHDVVVRSSRITFADVTLRTTPIQMEGIVVAGSVFPRSGEETTSRSSYSGEEIRRSPGSAGDVSRIFLVHPSVAKVSDQSNGLAVRGGNPSENSFFIDNIEVPNINHFPAQGSSSGPIGLLNTDLIKDASFYTGGFSARYGNRLSSVMEIELREGNREEVDAQLDLNIAGFGAVLEGPLAGGSGAYLASVRRSYLDLLVDAIGTETDMAPRYSDVTAKVVWDLGPRHRLLGLGILGLDEISATRDAALENDAIVYGEQRAAEGAVGMDWQAIWSDRFLSNTTLSFLHTEFREDFWETSSDLKLVHKNSGEGSLALRNTNRMRLGSSVSLRFGAEARLLLADYQHTMAEYTGSLGQPIPEMVVDDRVTTARGSLFGTLVTEPLPRLTATLGLRSDYFDYTGHLSLSPRVGFSFRATDGTRLNLSGGIFRQSLPATLLSQQDQHRDLPQPWALHLVGGVEHLLTDDTRLTVEGYLKDYRDFPVDPAEPGLFVMDEAVYRYGFFFHHAELVPDGRARSRGVEVLLQKKLAQDFYGLASASFSRSVYAAGDGVWRDRVFDNRWMASVEGGYKPSAKWEFSLRWIYAGGPPYTPLDVAASQAAGRDVLDASQINEARYPAYHSLNLRFDRRFYFSSSNLVWYVSIWNAYNRRNVAGYNWNAVKGEVQTTYQWGMLPVLGLEYEF